MSIDTQELLLRLQFRELALRYLDENKLSRSIVIADAILSYDGPIDKERPIRHQAHEFFQTARLIINNDDKNLIGRPFCDWLLKWDKQFGI